MLSNMFMFVLISSIFKTVKGWIRKNSMKRHGETWEATLNEFDKLIIGDIQDSAVSWYSHVSVYSLKVKSHLRISKCVHNPGII